MKYIDTSRNNLPNFIINSELYKQFVNDDGCEEEEVDDQGTIIIPVNDNCYVVDDIPVIKDKNDLEKWLEMCRFWMTNTLPLSIIKFVLGRTRLNELSETKYRKVFEKYKDYKFKQYINERKKEL